MTRLLEGKLALVTGGGSGIGRATSIVMAREGAFITVADLSGPAADETVELIRAAGGEAQAVVADESKHSWDLLKTVATVSPEDAFRPLNEGGCPLVRG